VLPQRSQLQRIKDPDWFAWATGIEDTFITAPWPATGRTLDEYELTGHYGHWREDFRLMSELGVRAARYGIPWHRVNPAPGRWDWTWADQTLERLLELGIDPIVDLVHYGLPGWIDGAYLHPDFGQLMAEYAGRLAERFRGRVRWYTPLNEPRITAWYCGKLGWWPPYRRGWTGFVAVMLGLCRGIVRAGAALHSVDPEIVLAHVDATDVYSAPDPALAEEVDRRQRIGFLALDLVSGRVNPDHPLWDWLLRQGAAERELWWFGENSIPLDVVGLNMYPMFSRKRLVRSPRGLRIQMPYGSPEMMEQLVELYWGQYRAPMLISETAARGPVWRRREWLDGSVQSVRRLRERGIPLVGYTWWPMYALVAWAYRQSNRPVSEYLEQMGLWDLDPGPEGDLRRVPTPLVGAYRELAEGGARAVGRLAREQPAQRRRTA
jgi:beta-glucosidase/6-phospho-beta-glucosidase/beta-galactosidase